MAIEFNHETNDIVNSTGQVKFNGVAVGGDNTPIPFVGSRGLFAGGYNVNTIHYITIPTPGNSVDFGDLVGNRYYMGGLSNAVRGVFAGGASSDVIQYVTISTTGNATDFGDLTKAKQEMGSASNGTRGVFAGSNVAENNNEIEYITIANTGNATDFGDLTVGRSRLAGVSLSLIHI